ncbi:MAG: hypothetical protein JWO89_1853 [Verrucomicrobiaceae bacterium]|nr:hypothetical protein [Verrucomicrobiaceae bacterium]
MSCRLPLTLVAAALLLSSCGSTLWKIQLKDGREFISTSEPELQKKTGYYRYKNLQGRDALLQAQEVLMVEQQ